MPANKPKGRLVLNHSTHVEGLIPVLEELATYPGIQTITPGALAKVHSRPSNLRLRISVLIRGGFKLQARKGTTVQEVFVITRLDRPEFEKAFQAALAKRG